MFAHAVGAGALPAPAWLLTYIGRGADARHRRRAADHVAGTAPRGGRAGTTDSHRGAGGPRHRSRRLRRGGGGGDRRTRHERRERGAVARRGRVVGRPADRVPALRGRRSPPEPVRAGGGPSRPGSRRRPGARAAALDAGRVPRRVVLVPPRLPPAGLPSRARRVPHRLRAGLRRGWAAVGSGVARHR